MLLKDKKVLVGLTGGIACYKVPGLIRFLTKEGAAVRVMMTRAATKFITPLTLETVSNQPVAIEMFPESEFVSTRHIDLAEWPDLIVVAPATANFLGKVAGGISDDLLTTIICASPRPMLIAPAMNPQMWANAITQRNVGTLRQLGHFFADPGEGEMACEQYGVGRMAEPEQIYLAVKCLLLGKIEKRVLSGRKVVVTAGPTREPLDPVRYLSNYSTGKMGIALAQAAVLLGADTTIIYGPTGLMPPAGVRTVSIESTDQLFKAVAQEFRQADCLIMAAAPADFAPARTTRQKIKKADVATTLALKPTVDILSQVAGSKKSGQIVVGFALETQQGLAHAKQKLNEKHLDMIVLNQPGRNTGFGSDTNRVTVLLPGKKPEAWPLMDKCAVAVKLLEKVASLR